MKVAIETLGCRSNYFDSYAIKTLLEEKGYKVVSPEEGADIYIVNTCTVTKGGDRSSRQAIYRFKRKNPNSIVIATGCYAQVSPQELAEIKDVDIVVGNSHKERIGEIIEEFLINRKGKIFHENIFKAREVHLFKPVVFFENARPFVKIQEGCNRFCTFCVVPYARGKVRSVPIKEVIDILKYIADKGFEEVVLSGTQLSQYGWDKGFSLYELLKEAVKIEGIKLIRLSSLHVKEVDDKTLDFLINEDKIAPHFHFPLQSASDRILKLMDRGYTLKEYEEKVGRIIKEKPYTAVGTDIIVGFPSEGEREFKETFDFVQYFPFAYIHVFPYSERPFTKARRLDGKVEEKVKRERVEIIKKIDEEKRKSFREINRGRELRATVLSEGRLLTENYIDIKVKCNAQKGKVIKVCVP